MECPSINSVFCGTLVCFSLCVLIFLWHYHSLFKILRVRHPRTYRSLGRPNLDEYSDTPNPAIDRFIKSDTHKDLGDKQLSRVVKVLRARNAVGVAVIAVLAVCLLLSPQPAEMFNVGCWKY